MSRVFEGKYFTGSLLETFGLASTNNGTTLFSRTSKGFALNLNGSSQFISYTGSVSVKSVIIFLKANVLSKDIISFDGGTHSIEVGAANVTATGFATPTILVDGVVSAALSANQWHTIIVTTNTSFTANAIQIGKKTSYFNGYIAYAAFDSAVITTDDINFYQSLFVKLRPWGKQKTGYFYPKNSDLSALKGIIAAAYNFDKGSVIDVTGNSHSGVDSGTPIPTLDGKRYKGSPDKTVLGNIGNIKSVSFRIKLNSTSEKIMEKAANSGLIYVNSGTLTAADFDTKYVDGVVGTTMVANQWHNVVLTNASNVNFSACTLALNNITYGNFEIADLQFYVNNLTLQNAKDYSNKYASRLVYSNDFSDEAVGTALPRGFIAGTGIFKVSELTASVAGYPELKKGTRVLECTTGGTIKLPIPNCYVSSIYRYSGGSWIKEGDNWLSYFATGSTVYSWLNGMLTIILATGDKLALPLFKVGEETDNYETLSQGLRITDTGSDFSYTRLGTISAVALGSSPGDAALPIHSQMRGCLLLDNGTVNYYLSATDWNYKADGITPSVLTGADGQVMIEIPKFYVKFRNNGTTREYYISLQKLKGSQVHPAFIKDGVEVSKRYIGAYEGVLYDVSGGTYTDGSSTQVKDFTATTGDKLSSVSGKLAVTNGTRAQFRTIAKNRGAGWRQLDYDLVNAIEILFIIEYGTFNCQSKFSGISNVSDWSAYNNYYPLAPSGLANAIGNSSGQNVAAASASAATATTGYSKYRGIENFYGHLWKWVDGFNINDNHAYISNNSAVWADNTSSSYVDPGVTLANSNGWQKTLVNSSRVILPSSIGGSSTTYMTDYYYQSTSWRVALFGGNAYRGANVGGFYWNLYDDSGDSDPSICGRLSF